MVKSPCLLSRESRRTEWPARPTSPGAASRAGGGGAGLGGGPATPSKRDPELFRRRGLDIQLLQLQQTPVRPAARWCGTPSRPDKGCPRTQLVRDKFRGSARGGDGADGGRAGYDWDGGGGGDGGDDWEGVGCGEDGGGDGGNRDGHVRLSLARLARRVEHVARAVSAVRSSVASMERGSARPPDTPRLGPQPGPDTSTPGPHAEVTRRIREAHERAQQALLELSATQARVSESRELLESRLGEKERLGEQLRLARDSLHGHTTHGHTAQGGQAAWLIIISIVTLFVSLFVASLWPRIVRGGSVY